MFEMFTIKLYLKLTYALSDKNKEARITICMFCVPGKLCVVPYRRKARPKASRPLFTNISQISLHSELHIILSPHEHQVITDL